MQDDTILEYIWHVKAQDYSTSQKFFISNKKKKKNKAAGTEKEIA